MYRGILLLFLILSDTGFAAKPVGTSAYTFVQSACTSVEKWRGLSEFPKAFIAEFESLLAGKRSGPNGFSEALAFRKVASNETEKTLAEYWISRSLYHSGMIHSSFNGFQHLTSQPLTKETQGIQFAALECMTRIQYKYPSIKFGEATRDSLLGFKPTAENQPLHQVFYTAIGILIRDYVTQGKPAEELQSLLKQLDGSGMHQMLAETVIYSHLNNPKKVVGPGLSFLRSSLLPKNLKIYSEAVRLLTARASYVLGQYGQAQNLLKAVKKNSNELAHALTELGWAFLVDDKLREAVGTALNLQTGGLRRTFSPEAPMIMAMGLNELCQYPQSVRAIDIFRSTYKDSYFWLTEWNKKKKFNINLYKAVIGYVRKQSDVPDRIASEWVRSTMFISRQEELNLILDEDQATSTLGNQGQKEQLQMAKALLDEISEFKILYDMAVVQLKPGESLPSKITNGLKMVQNHIAKYQRFRRAAPVWKNLLNFHEKASPALAKSLQDQIHFDLKKLNERMLAQIEAVAQNTQLIEVEIYNGASQDIIWRNAHPDYEVVANEIKNQERKTAAAAVYNWGSINTKMDGDNEIWEDELGSFKVDLYDNCNSKDQYLAIKRQDLLDRMRNAEPGGS